MRAVGEKEGTKIAKRIWVDPHKQLRNRKPVTGTVETGGTKKALFTGAYIALTVVVSNDSPNPVWYEIYDGDTKIVGRATLPANAVRPIAALSYRGSCGSRMINSDICTAMSKAAVIIKPIQSAGPSGM